MATMLDSLLSSRYFQQIPTQVPQKAAQGFIATAAISMFTGASASVAMLGGTIAATATLIEAVTRPIIKAIFPDNRDIALLYQIIVPALLALALATTTAPWIGISYKVSTFLLPFFALSALNQDFNAKNIALAVVV